MSDKVLEVGKLPAALLAEVLVTGRPVPPELLLPPTVGEDAGVVAVQSGALIAASDPVTLTGQDVGAHAVLVNANDIAVMGARPRWFTATVLLPPGITADEVRALYRRMHEALADLDAVLVGGHVEITDAVRRTVVSGHMMGLRQDGNFARTAALEPDYVVVQIGPAPVEGAAVLAAEARAQLEGKVAAAMLAEAEGALTDPGISVVDAALRATNLGATAMHDPTEGGLSAGLYEMAETAGVGLTVEANAVLWYEPGRVMAQALGIDPWGLLASGALLAAFPADAAEEALATLGSEGFTCAPIARADAGSGVSFEGGGAVPRFSRDEMIRVFSPEG
ncbi:MAG: AIR synthase related protein [Rhodospirillales bacterium]|nr:AIR synthase related protein [Rhodospirillales bacterium]